MEDISECFQSSNDVAKVAYAASVYAERAFLNLRHMTSYLEPVDVKAAALVDCINAGF